MFGLGAQELLIIFGIIIVIFGASKIPQLGRGLGEGIRNFKKGLRDTEPERLEEHKPNPTPDSPDPRA